MSYLDVLRVGNTDYDLMDSGAARAGDVSALEDDIREKLGGENYLFYSAAYTVENSAAYVSEVVYEKSGIATGDVYTLTATSVTGATATNVYWVRIQDANGTNVRQLSNATSQKVTVSASDISSGATKIQFVVYPAQGTALPTGRAVFAGLAVYAGDSVEYAYAKMLDEHILSLMPPIGADKLVDADVVFSASEYSIGATINNDSGNTTYIFKDFPVDVGPADMIGLSCDRVVDNVQTNCFYVRYLDQYGTLLNTVSYSPAQVKAGLAINPGADVARVVLRLYPSTTGGLTTTPCVFTNILFWKSADGQIRLKKSTVPDPYTVPAYYFKGGYLQNKAGTILTAMETAQGNYDAFVFCTDQHWRLNAQKSPALIKYLSRSVNIPRMFAGGDYDDGVNMDAYRIFGDAYGGAVYNVAGNHEYMDQFKPYGGSYASRTITGATIWACLNGGLRDAVAGDASRNYYYVDNTAQKMRYIILNVFTDGSVAEFASAQKAWLKEVALDLPSGFTAVIFAHYIAEPNHTTGALTMTAAGAEIASIADAHTGDGEIACLIAGHTHFDGQGATSGGIPVFVTTCDKYGPAEGYDDWLENYRTVGTITEQAFDVFVIDKTNRVITAVRIGAPANNPAGTDLEVRTAQY